uniref:Uncharacterized protein n=1 Tax=Octopus bimaculoides TaxID=37653 RepID=A0A0L8I7C8_OCTBM
MCSILMCSGGVVYGWLLVFMSSFVMFVFVLMYSINSEFFVLMAVSIVCLLLGFCCL